VAAAMMQLNRGYTTLAAHTRLESIDEMRHAEILTDRILFLERLPNFQRLFPLRIGETVREQLDSDMLIEVEAVERLRRGIDCMRSVGDVTSARLFEQILADEEHHIDYLETQLQLLDTSERGIVPAQRERAPVPRLTVRAYGMPGGDRDGTRSRSSHALAATSR
jgi:bacterioferritin